MSKPSSALVLATAIDSEATTSAIMHGGEKLGETTETELVLYHPEALSFEMYEEMGRLLGSQNRRLQWVIGDWLNLVEDIYPDRYSQAVEATRLSEGTLMNRASICKRIPRNRRRPGIPFSVHADVAYLEPDERDKWLDRAERGDWKREELREHMRAEGALVPRSERPRIELEPAPEALPPPRTQRVCPECGHEFDD